MGNLAGQIGEVFTNDRQAVAGCRARGQALLPRPLSAGSIANPADTP